MSGDMAEGVLYFGDSARNGVKASEHVSELRGADDLKVFLSPHSGTSDRKIVMVSTSMCSPCIHVVPSTLMLAMNFKDVIDFAKLEDDGAEDLEVR